VRTLFAFRQTVPVAARPQQFWIVQQEADIKKRRAGKQAGIGWRWPAYTSIIIQDDHSRLRSAAENKIERKSRSVTDGIIDLCGTMKERAYHDPEADASVRGG
jgi:hypothetical protein